MYIQVRHLTRMPIGNGLGKDCGLNRRRMAAFPCPGNFNLFNSAILAFCARNTAMQVGFELKEKFK